MKKKQIKSKREIINIYNEEYILPSHNIQMKDFISTFKIDMMEHVIKSIKYAIENKLPIIEVFQFKDTPFVITINETEYFKNLRHIKNYFKKEELFELCPEIERLENIVKDKDRE